MPSRPSVFAEGVVGVDPFAGAPTGTQVRIEKWRFLHSLDYKWDDFDGVLLKVGFVAPDGALAVSGTAVMVAPNVAISARHVFESELQPMLDGNVTYVVVAILRDEKLAIWDVARITVMTKCDVVLLALTRRTPVVDCRIKQAIINLRIPSIGEQVMACGFRATGEAPDRESEATGVQRVVVVGGVHYSFGQVTEVYPVSRDRCFITWPCFEINVSCKGGMSGGPVFDQKGLLVGIICSSFSTDDTGGPSYVATLHAALDAEIIFPLVERSASLSSMRGNCVEIVDVDASGGDDDPTASVDALSDEVGKDPR